ncbi:LOW QUALITY PROTEIN: NAD(P)H-quinone oxidoreductase chain 4, chloroplastic, partial [Syzygium oleosum]|uniref:LOW QUALITY PROTEIN: NAD(P)H-quinone oxidoreductase chain 4, chloroplastic n=1 Tax=Syzygium oleosum TaxID=219896 RepID=UPI0024BA2761
VSAGSSICFLPHIGNKWWYTIFIPLLEFLLMTYAFCYHFQLTDDPLIQFEEETNSFHLPSFFWGSKP